MLVFTDNLTQNVPREQVKGLGRQSVHVSLPREPDFTVYSSGVQLRDPTSSPKPPSLPLTHAKAVAKLKLSAADFQFYFKYKILA